MEIYEKYKLYRAQKKAYKNLPQYRKYWYFNLFMKIFLALLILSFLFALLTKLINAQVNGNGIQSQFWLGPHGEIVALDSSNCMCDVSYYWDFIANIFLIIVIPIFAVFFLTFLALNYWMKIIFNRVLRNSQNDPFFWSTAKAS